MIQKIVQYGDPVLRKRGERVAAITPAILSLIGDLIETMYDSHGIGLAAQQIGHAFQVTVVDVRSADRPSTLELDNKPGDVNEFMPLVLINPEVKPVGERTAGAEGCLSFPEIFGNIKRAETVDVAALNEKGQHIEFRCGGLLARAIQHEVDHLNGILFIDRMDAETKREQMSQLKTLKEGTTRLLQKERV
jgi:peptide deformylase